MNTTNIMFTDMVGYSKLTGDDQNLALELLKEHDKIIEPIIKRYNGTIVKRIGDAIVAIFDDAGNIIQSSVEIQQSLKNRNTRNIQSRYIILRIGLHHGDIILKNKEIHGSGYEIASQIEPICEYGGIAISKDLYDKTKEKNELIIKGAKNHFFIRPIAKFNLKSSRINVYKLHLNLLDWYDEAFNQSYYYLSKQGISEDLYTPFNIQINSDNLDAHLDLAKDFEKSHNLSYAIYHYKIYLDYNFKNEKYKFDKLDIELNILHIFAKCGLIRLVERVLKTLAKNKCTNKSLYHFIMGLNAFNNNNLTQSIPFFKESYRLMVIGKNLRNYFLPHFYLSLIFYKTNKEKELVKLCKSLQGSKNPNDIFLVKIFNAKSSADDFRELYLDIEKNKDINKEARLFFYWCLIEFYKRNDIKVAITIQDQANKVLEDLSQRISGFQLKNFFIEKPLLHQFLMEEIEFNFIDDEGLDDFAEPERPKANQLETFNFCIECGFKNENNFQFCPTCGVKLTK